MEKSRVHSNLLIVEKNVAKCAAKCLPDCILPASLVPNLNDAQVVCKLGCASSLCTNFSTKENPAGEKVEGCVDSCSEICTKI
ncbi:hypothetical protein WN944_022139 [Citrus x changshan-huyou]|uniref:Thionin-like protein n=1 Tax=Citrus x changshan-huyou TaxID=2935761 RepID=A0AAP0MXZ0_9ROSI